MRDSPKNVHNQIFGKQGESAACRYLKKRGYKILKRNYKTPFGEADIIAFRRGVYAFVEVKARETDAFGLPSEAVTREKQRRYRAIAQYFCMALGEEVPVRFDVASYYGGEIEYFENAFV